jgi:hypothetical protein
MAATAATDYTQLTDDQLQTQLVTTQEHIKNLPHLADCFQDKLINIQNEQQRRSTVVVGTQAVPDQTVPLGAAQLPAAAPVVQPSAAQRHPVRLRAAKLSVEAKERWLDKMRTRIKRVHAKLVAAVYKNIAPDDVINHVLDAICNQEGRGAELPAKFNHLVLINGHVQRGKTCIKALEAAAVWEIFKDDEVIDKPFSIIITPMVPWAKQLANGFQKLTGAANIVTDPASEPSVQNAGADDSDGDDSDAENDPTEVENPFAGGMPQCMLSTLADLNDAMDQVADKGGAVIISRSKGALEKAIQLVYLLNKRALSLEGDKVVRSPLIALDEVDKMVGSCTSARGSKRPDPTGKVPTIYENLVNLMCGFADLPNGQGVDMCYDSRSFDALKANSSSSRKMTAVLRTNRNIPFLISAVSATNAGYCAWALSRVGVPHASPKVERDLLSLLDIVSFNEPSENEYRGANQAVKFGDIVLEDKEISTQNKWCCEKTLAIESAAAQTPGSCLMVCTTTTVNEGTVRGLSMQRVHHEHLVRTEIGRRMAAMACGVQIGYDEGGQFQLFMHGGHKAYKGMLGIGYTSPSDPFGVAKLRQFEALCAYHKTKTQARIAALEEQLRLEGDDMADDDKAIVKQEKDSTDRLDMMLRTSMIAFRDRARRTAAQAPKYARLLDRVILALQKAGAAERIYTRAETASESGVPGAAGTPTPDQLQKLYERKSALRSDATEQTEKLINLRHEIATDRKDSENGEQFSTCLFGQGELLPLLVIWERELKARKSSYLPLAPTMEGGSRKKNDLNTAHVSMLLGFVRSLDCSFMLGALPPQFQAQTEAARSKNVSIKVVGMGCIRRSMHVIGYYIDAEGNDVVTSTLSHVLQYSNHDGASQEQQIKRFATTAVQHNRGVPIQVLTSARGWLAMKGHVAYNDMPEWRRPEAERRAWAKRFTELARRKLALEPLADEHIEQVNSILSREIKIQKNKEAMRPGSDMKRTMRIMMETMTIPLAFARMCMYLPSPLFAGANGREYGALFVRAREAQRIVDPTRNNADDDDQDLADPAPPPKKKRVVRENVIHAWIRKVLVALVAFGDEATNDVASAVGHGVIWTHLKQLFRHVWDDPDENARLLAAHKAAWDILNPDNNEGGLGHYLGDMVKKGAIFRVEQGDPRMPKEKRKNLAWYLKRGSVALADEPGPSVALSEAGPSAAAHVPLPAQAWEEAQAWADHEAFAMEVEERVAGASNDDAFEHDSDSDVVAQPLDGAKRDRAPTKRLTADRLGGPATISYTHTGVGKRKRADDAASSAVASSEELEFGDDSGDESANVSDSDDEDSGDDYVEGTSDDESASDDEE